MGGLGLLGILGDLGDLVFVTISFKISDFTKNKKQDPHIFLQWVEFEKIQ